MSLGSVGGTIGTVVGLGITLGALGLALEFTDRAFDRASPNPRRTGKRKPLFDTSLGTGKQRRQMAFDSGKQNINSVFDPMPTRKSKRRDNPFGDFF